MYFANNADSKTAAYFAFQMFGTTSTTGVPTEGNFTIVAVGSIPTAPGQYAWGTL